jgi:cobalamin biosynthesis Mg chelatase CobN
MRRRICLAVGLVALSVPASGWAQSSSQAQYQGVAPETQLPVTGTGGGGSTNGGAGTAATGSTQSNNSDSATGGGRPVSGGNRGTSGAAGNGGPSATATQTKVALPDASSSTSPFSGGDILWIVLAIAGLTGLGLLLRRTTRRSPAV